MKYYKVLDKTYSNLENGIISILMLSKAGKTIGKT